MLSLQQHKMRHVGGSDRASQTKWQGIRPTEGPKPARSDCSRPWCWSDRSVRWPLASPPYAAQAANTVNTGHASSIATVDDYQLVKPAHMVHVHPTLPLKRAALGNSGQFVLVAEPNPWNPKYARGAVHWSDNLPCDLREALTEITTNLHRADAEFGIVALGKTDACGECWLVREKHTYQPRLVTWTGADVELLLENATFIGEFEGVGKKLQPAVIGDDEIKEVYLAPDSGWYVETNDEAVAWHSLPKSLEAALTKYREAYSGVSWLSVGHGGEWFVKYNNGSFQWDGLHPVLEQMLRRPGPNIGEPVWFELGPAKTFVAQFEMCSVWYGGEDLTAALLGTIHCRTGTIQR